MRPIPLDLYLILDPEFTSSRALNVVLSDALKGGVRLFQYRDKRGSKRLAFDTVNNLLHLIRSSTGLLIINDDIDLALASGADGVHLGQEDFPIESARAILPPASIIGGSAHTVDQAMRIQEASADYIGIGPVFPSTTKQARAPLGCDFLAEIRRKIRIPVFAIGGIGLGNLEPVLGAGVDGVACVSAILSQPDIRRASEEMISRIELFKRSHTQ